MDYLQAVQEIEDVVPDIQKELKKYKIQNSYSVVQTFTDRIKRMIRQNDRYLLFKSLKKMNSIYRKGDTLLKSAVEHTFIYSLDSCTICCSEEYRKVIFSCISREMQQIYSRQVYKHSM